MAAKPLAAAMARSSPAMSPASSSSSLASASPKMSDYQDNSVNVCSSSSLPRLYSHTPHTKTMTGTVLRLRLLLNFFLSSLFLTSSFCNRVLTTLILETWSSQSLPSSTTMVRKWSCFWPRSWPIVVLTFFDLYRSGRGSRQ